MARARKTDQPELRLIGPVGEVLLEGRLADGQDLEALRSTLLSRRWRIDDDSGAVLAHPGGVNAAPRAAPRDRPQPDTAASSGADAGTS